MSHIISKVKRINNLWIDQLPAGKIVKIVKAVRVNELTLFVGESGKLYSNALKRYAYAPGEYPWNNSLMRALVKFGVITNDDLNRHLSDCKARHADSVKEWDRGSLSRMADRHGFKITPEQKQKLGFEGVSK